MPNEIKVELTLEEKQALSALTKLTKRVDKFGDEAEKSGKQASSAFSTFKGVVGAQALVGAVKGITSAMIGLGSTFIDKASEIEQIKTQFVTLTGSGESASKMIKDLQQFAASTPFQLPGIAKASQQLLAFGFSQDEIVPKLQQLGDVAAGSGAQLSELSLIYGQVQAASKLTGERLLQLQERAIPIGPALAKTMGVAETAVKDLVSQGKVDFATFEQAFATLSAKGGLFFEGMVKQSKTLGGVMSTLGDNVDLVSADIGDAFLPVIKTAVIEVIKFIQANKGLIDSLKSEAFQSFIKNALQATVDAITATVVVVDTLNRAFRAAFNAITAAASTFAMGVLAPFALIEQGINALIQAVPGLSDKFGEGSNAISGIMDSLSNQVQTDMKDISEAFVEDTFLSKTAEKVAEFSEGLDTALSAEKAVLEQRVAANKEANEKIKESEKEKKDFIALLKEEEAIAAEEEKLAKEVAAGEDRETELATLAEQQTALAQMKSNFSKEDLAFAKKVAAQRKKDKDKQTKEEQTSLASMFNFEKNTNAGRASNMRSTLGSISSLSDSHNKGLAIAGKAAAVTTTTIDGIVAVQKALASAPPPFNFILAGLVGAATAANINKIRSQSLAGGGIVSGPVSDNDNTQVNAAGGEMFLNRRQQTEVFNAINSGGVGGGLSVNIEGNVIADDETAVSSLIEKINDAIEFNNADLRVS